MTMHRETEGWGFDIGAVTEIIQNDPTIERRFVCRTLGLLEESQLDVAIDDDIAWPIAHAKALVVDASFPVFHLTDTGSPLLDTAARLNAIISGVRQ